MVQACPKCGLLSPSSAQRCDCGFDFVAKTIEANVVADDIARLNESSQSIIDVLVKVAGRAALAVLITLALLVALYFVIVVAALGGGFGQRGEMFLISAVTAVLCAIGWALLPAIRYSIFLASLSLSTWVALGVCLYLNSLRGWLVLPWLASSFVTFCFVLNSPPDYFIRAKRPIEETNGNIGKDHT